MKIQNKNILITGGASGIGKIMGRMALEKGAKSLIIFDVNLDGMQAVAEEFKSLGKVFTYKVDVTSEEEINATLQQVSQDCGNIDILINCAGIIRGNKTFDQQTMQDIRMTMEVNTIAPMVLANKILPGMLERGEGHICNIASAAGMISNPKLSVYVASKWAVIGWSDSVRIEMKQSGKNVHITTVTPYYITTGMFQGVESKIFPLLKPEATSRKIIRAIEKNQDFCGIPWSFHFIRLMQGLLPTVVFDWFFGSVFGIFKAMDHFTGRK